MRCIIVLLFCCLLSAGANATCASATPPAVASAVGLTTLILCDDFTDTTTIDVTDTRVAETCRNAATAPVGKCHWFTHRAWPDSVVTPAGGLCAGTFSATNGKCVTNESATIAADYSTNGSGLQLTPRVAQTTGNNTNGTNTITGLSVVSGTLPTTSPLIGVYGPGIPSLTTATISGTTATLSANTSAGSTGGTYYFVATYNGFMLQSAAAVTADPGYVGMAFQPPFFAEATITYASAGNAQWTIAESSPNVWAWPLEMYTAAHSGAVASNRDFCELDIKESQFGQTLHSETINGDGQLYWASNQLGGHTNYYANTADGDAFGTATFGVLVTNPPNGSGGANVGEVNFTKNGASQNRVLFGPSTVPTLNGSTTVGFSAGAPLPSGFFDGTSSQHYCGSNHYVLQMDGAPNWPMTNISIRVWGLPTGVGRSIGKFAQGEHAQ